MSLFKKDPSVKRHIAKTLTWRFVGTLDTILLSWIISGNAVVGLSIGGAELFTKMLLYYLHERTWYKIDFGIKKRRETGRKNAAEAQKNIVKHDFGIKPEVREKLKGHKGVVVWFTGLSGSGKSTIAEAFERELVKQKIHTFTLDGDNTRLGINSDLDFTETGRKENIRRVAEVAKLMADSGLVVITSFISPFIETREQAKKIIGENRFVEVFVNTPMEICEQRDVKGLYAKARKGEIKNFTGISSPYEISPDPDIHLKFTEKKSIDEYVQEVMKHIQTKIKLEHESA